MSANHGGSLENALEIVKCFKDYGGEASCAMIAQKYGRTAGFYNIGSTKLAKRIIKYTGCPNPQNSDGTDSFWPVLYTGRNATSDEYGAFIWKLRPQLSEALDSVDLSDIELYGNHSDENDNTTHYWWLDANPNIWSFSNISVGQCEEYSLYNSNGNKRRVFQNFLDAKVGDKVIGYESAPIKQNPPTLTKSLIPAFSPKKQFLPMWAPPETTTFEAIKQ